MAVLLPPDALARVRVGISISDSSDLARLGLTDTHLRLALGEVARAVLVGGGKLAYPLVLTQHEFRLRSTHRHRGLPTAKDTSGFTILLPVTNGTEH
jgi:hypothetical protein